MRLGHERIESRALHRRRLPHCYPEGRTLFLTFCLAGAVPKNLYPPPDAPNAGQAFAWMDRYLDHTRKGPFYLRRPEVAEAVVETLHYCQCSLAYFELDSFVVMPNHVHLLVNPHVSPTILLRSLKSYSARQANRLIGRSGPFWQRESYDHVVRNEKELCGIRAYIENNPVRALLARKPGDYPYSSAYERIKKNA